MNHKKWTVEYLEKRVVPLLKSGWTVAEVARNFDVSRQFLYKALDRELGKDWKGKFIKGD